MSKPFTLADLLKAKQAGELNIETAKAEPVTKDKTVNLIEALKKKGVLSVRTQKLVKVGSEFWWRDV